MGKREDGIFFLLFLLILHSLDTSIFRSHGLYTIIPRSILPLSVSICPFDSWHQDGQKAGITAERCSPSWCGAAESLRAGFRTRGERWGFYLFILKWEDLFFFLHSGMATPWSCDKDTVTKKMEGGNGKRQKVQNKGLKILREINVLFFLDGSDAKIAKFGPSSDIFSIVAHCVFCSYLFHQGNNAAVDWSTISEWAQIWNLKFTKILIELCFTFIHLWKIQSSSDLM